MIQSLYTSECNTSLSPQGGAGATPAASDISAAALLLEVLRESDASVLNRWQPHAAAIAEAAAVLAANVDARPSAGVAPWPNFRAVV